MVSELVGDGVDKAIAWDKVAEKNAEIARLKSALSDAVKALEDISSPSQSLNLLWWQIRARDALASIRGEP